MFPVPHSRSPEDRRGWRQGDGASLWREGVAARAWVEKEMEMAVWVTGAPPCLGFRTHGGSLKPRPTPELLTRRVRVRPRNWYF